MPVTEATLRRIAAMPHEAAIEALLFLADQMGEEESRKSKDRERKRRGKATEFHGNGVENPRNSTELKSPVVEDKTSTLQSTDKSTSSPPQSRHQQRISRGTRWPDDFVPKPAPLEYWRANSGYSDAEYWEEFQQTGDFWRQRPGSKGLSLDWDLVWLNRVKFVCKQKKERLNARTSTYSKPLSISERLAGFAAKLDQADGEGGDCGGGEDAAGLPRLRQSA